jgi:putative transport protein
MGRRRLAQETASVARRWPSARLAALLIPVAILLLAVTSGGSPQSKNLIHQALEFLGEQTFVLLFLVVTAGYLLGKVEFGGVGFGTTGATLLVALEMSVWALAGEGIQFEVSAFASTIFFNLFMFAVGMKVGPQFVSGLRRNAGKFVFLAVLIPALSFGLVLVFKKLVHLEPGITPGLFSGANTATPGLGAAQSAYASGEVELHGVTTDEAVGNLSTAFAFTYCVTMVLFILLLKVLPRLFGRDARADARSYLESTTGSAAPLPGEAEAFLVGTLPVATRAYALEQRSFCDRQLGELRQSYPMVAVERILRGGRLLAPADDLKLQSGDAVALFGTVARLIDVGPQIGHEIDAPELLEKRRQTVDLIIENPELIGSKLVDLAKDVGHGIYLNAMFRGGESIPFGPETTVERGDVLRVTGAEARIARLERQAGRVVRPSFTTDMVTLGIGLAVGAGLGAIMIPVGSAKLTLSSSVGLLLVGILLSSLRTRRPALGGPFPEPARQLLEDLGLSVFVAILGLNAGSGVLHAIASGSVLPIVLGSLFIGLLPPVVGWVVGLYVLRMNSALLLGAVAGGSCNAAGMRAAQETTDSTVPAFSYPVAFAIANVLFTLLTYATTLME